ncbi:manganese efflux pump MntP [Sphingomonas immobilis]|uniref:Putative manganese efflux pump MntP n=1 Tax=Sphingomonas immobilis TaxID=3063997 RepID=A0ABT8ZYZ0_9SPHN|nr:manganese efflux pump MntP family protein [Sphingomonas sp. CA1-15]MDO7842798.1 manganese efflux pump MntP family protein [Sphingomonas sp. CA1-15]
MTPLAILALSLSMSADAFAASIGRGASHRPNWNQTIKSALVFGVVEGITPVIGWLFGKLASGFVGAVAPWIAFALLIVVGGRMIWEAFHRDQEDDAPPSQNPFLLIAMAIGTSIDAAAVGVSLALIGTPILIIALCIGVSTLIITGIGLRIGRAAGDRLGSGAEVIGGLVLIGFGVHTALEQLGYLG